MMPTRLLWGPLPDPLPSVDDLQPGWRRKLLGVVSAVTSSALPTRELVTRRVRRACVQALVREAYNLVIADQEGRRRHPAEFAQAWREHLEALLAEDVVNISGWGEVVIADVDTGFAWELFEVASHARQHALRKAEATPSEHVGWVKGTTDTFKFTVVSDGDRLGEVTYGVCSPCGTGLLYKISFDSDWQFCGLGRMSLREIETRHPGLTWYTTAQYGHARGFYDRYRRDSDSPWTDRQNPCQHFN